MKKKTNKTRKVKAWAILDLRSGEISFTTLVKNNWYIAPTERNRFRAVPCTITYSLPKNPKTLTAKKKR